MKRLQRFVLIIVLVGGGCSSDDPVATGKHVVYDSCCNDDQISALDSATQHWPTMDVQYEVASLRVSQVRGLWAGLCNISGWKGVIKRGVFVYNPASKRICKFIYAYSALWSPDGEYLLCESEGGKYDLYKESDMSLINSYYVPFSSLPSWAMDGKRIYYSMLNPSSGDELWSIELGTGKSTQVFNNVGGLRELNQDQYVGFDANGLFLVDKDSGIKAHVIFDWVDYPREYIDQLAFEGSLDWDISPDRTKVLVDLISKQGFMLGRQHGGLFLLDVERKEIRRIKKQQYWGTRYVPTWVTNTRYYATYFCRNTSYNSPVSMVWEYDISGNVIKQITYPWMILYPQ